MAMITTKDAKLTYHEHVVKISIGFAQSAPSRPKPRLQKPRSGVMNQLQSWLLRDPDTQRAFGRYLKLCKRSFAIV
jgi:hypothetical protein